MVVIDTKNDTAYECLSKSEAARIVGVDRSTMYRWALNEESQVYNSYIVYFKTVRHKQPKGNVNASFRPPDYRRP